MSTYIPEEIIKKCAAEAFKATQLYYNPEYYGDRRMPDLYGYDGERHAKRVEKDVKAVLLGNRTAADLHDAWADRKFFSTGKDLNKLRKRAPSAMKTFKVLPPEDQEGYELFVRTVKKTYDKLTAQSEPAEVMVDAYQIDQLVIIRFKDSEEAHSFYRKLEPAKGL